MDENKPNLLDTMMDKRRNTPKKRKVIPGNLLDILFDRRKEQENSYKNLMGE